ncbi:neuroligin-4, Y-linked-like, partial [Sitophilus oryzae]|uniref:Neuroligin-4, Y-linked-like n=1 Tax=Sitophilus oryzae TaxID=7048 RepID=A0A6J2X278_SITOR
MCYITKSMTIIITLYSVSLGDPNVPSDQYYNDVRRPSREIFLKKQGYVQGMIVRPRNSELPWVEVYRGIPYAAPPIGHLRFMPPSSTLYTWQETKYAYEFGPVCPQKFPDESTMIEERKRYFLRLKKYLLNESEDCLYLNIYAPYQ